MKRLSFKKIVFIFAIFLISITIISAIYLVYQSQFDAKLYIYSAPDKLTMSYGSITKSIKSKEDIPVKSGKYSYIFKANGFKDYNIEIDIQKGEKKTIIFSMTPETDAARKELQLDKYSEVFEGISGEKMRENATQLEEKNAVLKKLPFYSRWYYILPCQPYRSIQSKSKRIGICVTIPDENNQTIGDNALKKLKEFGADKETYDIKINNNIVATDEEIKNQTVISCGKDKPSWCYRYADI